MNKIWYSLKLIKVMIKYLLYVFYHVYFHNITVYFKLESKISVIFLIKYYKLTWKNSKYSIYINIYLIDLI